MRDRLRVPTAEDIRDRRERCGLGRHDYEAVLRCSAQGIFCVGCRYCKAVKRVPYELWREMVNTQDRVRV